MPAEDFTVEADALDQFVKDVNTLLTEIGSNAAIGSSGTLAQLGPVSARQLYLGQDVVDFASAFDLGNRFNVDYHDYCADLAAFTAALKGLATVASEISANYRKSIAEDRQSVDGLFKALNSTAPAPTV